MGVRGRTVPPAPLLGTPGGSAVGLVGLNWWLWLGYGRAPWDAALSSTSASSCFVAAGMLVWRLRPRSRIGPWLIVMGLVMLVDNLNSDIMLSTGMPGRGLIELIGEPAHWLHNARLSAAKMLALPDPPAAIFAANDVQAMGVYEAAREHHLRIPDKLSVVGFDDVPMAQWMAPPLTTLRQPLREMAALAVRTLLSGDAASYNQRVELATNLVIRSSTA